jgi:hypothetical protein
MALALKTIEHVFPTYPTASASATRYNYPAQTIYIPETISRTFKSVIMEVFTRDTVTSSLSITSVLQGIQLGTASSDDVTVTTTLASTGKSQTFLFSRDATSYFNTNFGTGTSQSCQVGVTFTGIGTINSHVKLYITYEYDITNTTRIKTVRIPLESNTSTLTATSASIGTSPQIPSLDTFLPEASKTYRQIWFEISANEVNTATTNIQLAVALDSESEVLDGLHVNNLYASVWYKRIWIRNDMATNAIHDFKARSTTTARFMTLVVLLCVTYEYNHTNSTSIMNSLVLPVASEPGFVGGTSVTDISRQQQIYYLAETNPSLKQSAVQYFYSSTGTLTSFITRVGSQSYRTYTHTQGTTAAGMYNLQHRIDSGSTQGAAITLTRGKNIFIFDFYTTGTGAVASNCSAVLYLNYTSDKHPSGDNVHTKTIYYGIMFYSVINLQQRYVSTSIPLYFSETNYRITGLGFLMSLNIGGQDTGITLLAEFKSGEGPGDGWSNIYTSQYDSSTKRGITICSARAESNFNRYTLDPDSSRMVPTASRVYRLEIGGPTATGSQTNSNGSVYAYYTYHSIPYIVSGTVSGYTGDGSGIPVSIYRYANNELVFSLTTGVGGTFSTIWYDNTEELYAVARQSSTLLGRSDNTLAT